MANSVINYITAARLSSEGKKRWEEIMAEIRKLPMDQTGEYNLSEFFGEKSSRGEMVSQVGAKWAYAYDLDDVFTGGFCVRSAWSPVGEFVDWIATEITKVDNTAIITLLYEDEMPNFIGAHVYTNWGLDDSMDLDAVDIPLMLIQKHPELAEVWDDDVEEWIDDGEQAWEHIGPFIDDWHNNALEQMLHSIYESEVIT